MAAQIVWSKQAWEEYLYWQTQDTKTLKKINSLIKSLQRNNKPLGKAELLKGSKRGLCSARMDSSNRLVYKLEEGNLIILGCRGHY